MQENMEGTLRRVQKLLAIAQDDRANPQEAAAAAQMAEKIMRKYQIDHSQFIQQELKSGKAMKVMATSANMKRDDPSRPRLTKNPSWAGWLAYRVAKLNDCETRFGWDNAKGATVEFFGYDSDVQVSTWTFDYLVGVLIGAMKTYQRSGVTRSKAESESYRRGFVLAVCSNLQRMAEQKQAEAHKAQGGSYALVVSKQQAIVEHFGATTYRTAKSASSVRDGIAYAAGFEVGSKVDINVRGVGSSTINETRRLK